MCQSMFDWVAASIDTGVFASAWRPSPAGEFCDRGISVPQLLSSRDQQIYMKIALFTSLYIVDEAQT